MSMLRQACLGLGGLSLFAAVLVDFFGVVARHVGLRLLGSIEITQFCIVGAISTAVALATLEGAHASVHLLVTRVGPRVRHALERVSEAFSVVVFAGLLAGNIWVLIDLLPLNERSDLLHLPFAPARMFWCLSLAICMTLALVRLFARPQLDPTADV